MIRTIVADDEPFLRKFIIQSIEESNSEFEIISEAGNGKDALDMVMQLRPDVLFVDIKMPLMSGIEVLKAVHECSSYSPICVIISGYSDFEYAQKAIKYNTFDFLLKPLDLDYLSELLGKIEAQINLRYQTMQSSYFDHLLHNSYTPYTQSELKFAFSQFHYFYSFYVCIGSYSVLRYNQFNSVGNYWMDISFDEQLNMLTQPGEALWIIHGQPENECFLLLGVAEEDKPRHSYYLTMMQKILDQGSLPVTLLYDDGSTSLSNFKSHFMDMHHELKNCILYAQSRICHFGKEEEYTTAYPQFSNDDLNMLHELLQEKKYEAALHYMGEYLNQCEACACTQVYLTQSLKRFYESIAKLNVIQDLDDSVNELISNTMSYPKLREGIKDAMMEHLQGETDPHLTTIHSIKVYIDQHYAEQLSLGKLADTFNYSISYLSTLFKNTYGSSPNEYIISLRMEKAKILLRSHIKYNIKSIAQMVGYSDAYYFSRLFKMYTGYTPSEYRLDPL